MQSRIASAVDVSACVVTSSTIGRREVLIAHISTTPGKPVPSLRAVLGDDQIPDHIACWDVIPVSAAGQQNHAELDAEVIGGSCLGYGLDTAEKHILAGIWADILHSKALGSGDSFLELGGHSILAIRMLACVREVLGVRIPIYEFLDDPTITGVARQVTFKSALINDKPIHEDATD
jgi:hypothetical protein